MRTHRYGDRLRYRIRAPAMVKDVANPEEVVAILRRHGKLEFMVDA